MAINVDYLVQQLEAKKKKFEKIKEQVEEIVSDQESVGTAAYKIVSEFTAIPPETFDFVSNSFDDFFDELFFSEKMMRSTISEMALFSIQNSGKATLDIGSNLLGSTNNFKDILTSIRNMSDFDFLPSTNTNLIDAVIENVNKILAVNMNYPIPGSLVTNFNSSVDDIIDGFWCPQSISDLANSDIVRDFGLISSSANSYNHILTSHGENNNRLTNSNLFLKRNKMANIIRDHSQDIRSKILQYTTEVFPFSAGNLNLQQNICQMLQDLLASRFQLDEPDYSPFAAEVSSFDIQKLNLGPIDTSALGLADSKLKRIMSLVYGAAGQRYNLSAKEVDLKSEIDDAMSILDNFTTEISSNVPHLTYDFDSDIFSHMDKFTKIIDQRGHDMFSKALKGADWSLLDSLTPNTTTVAGAVAEAIRDGAAADIAAGAKAIAENAAQHITNMLAEHTYEDALEEYKKEMEEEITKTEKQIRNLRTLVQA